MTTPYAGIDEFKRWVRAAHDNVSADDPELDLALESACREIDAHCGRSFNGDTTVSARTFRPVGDLLCWTDDFWSTTGLVIKTDDNDDGTFETTWASADYELEPVGGLVDGLSGFPFWQICAVDDRSFPGLRRRSVEVTAKWGWAAVPDPVRRAALVLGAAIYTTRNAPTGNAGMGEFGMVRVPVDQLRMVRMALQPYVRVDRALGYGIG